MSKIKSFFGGNDTFAPRSRKSSVSSSNSDHYYNGSSRRGSVSAATSNTTNAAQATLSRRNSAASSTKQPRFEHDPESGEHVHHLKSGRRQEKLSSMLKELLGGKKTKDDAVSAVPQLLDSNNQQPPQQPHEQPPSLMSGLVKQIQHGQRDADSVVAHASANSESFVQKYGKCQEVIGRGSFGVVRVSHKPGANNQTDQLYAVKEFKRRPQESEKDYNKRLTSEFCISSSLHHPNIIQTLDLLKDPKGEFCEVMEYCTGGDLYTLILATGKLDFLEADCFFKQILKGVNYMHEMGVAHRDLKPENILLTAQGAVKITDFGNGECFRMAWETEIHLSNGLCGSAPYIAPEEFCQGEFDPRAVDIWAVGVIYMAMRTGRHLWTMAKPGEDDFYDRYLKGRKCAKGYDPIESLKRARCRNVIYSILDPVPQRRINGRQILKSEWGREIRVCRAGEQGF